ncbi:hypothetical protein [Pseudonocardia kunmingensis]|uniref:Uncharacterized protein n=1 Tax=Pseudonocardia kunmingensis TaxID=630975 RepID=A0A543DQ41_9PSEU|nr:hypothetical protein [Pseudonocardia kunmingensis]TQM11457.1 hypothetical protein FB558_4020 [Pseudonocardia kunmingensis]
MSRTMRIVLTGVLTTGVLVTGGIALAAGPSGPLPEGAVVEQAGPGTLRPIQNPAPGDCPWEQGSDGTAVGPADQL